MNKIVAIALLIAADVLILARYPLDPSAERLFLGAVGRHGHLYALRFALRVLLRKLGAFTGPVMRGGYVSHETPAGLFFFFGYLLQLLPGMAVCCRTLAGAHGLPTATLIAP